MRRLLRLREYFRSARDPALEPTDRELARWDRVSGPTRRKVTAFTAGAALAGSLLAWGIVALIDPGLARGWGISMIIAPLAGAGIGLAVTHAKRDERIRAWRLIAAMEKDDSGSDDLDQPDQRADS